MELLKQSEIARLRGEDYYSEMLRAIIVDEITLAKEKARKKKLADNLMFSDEDYQGMVMDITLCVHIDGQIESVSMCKNLDEMQGQCFAPLNTSDDRLLGALAYDATEMEAKIITKTREDAAEIIAKELSVLIVREMRKNDTHNGYKE